MNPWLLLAAAFLLVHVETAFAGEAGDRVMTFLTLDGNARAAAMGGAHTALARGASALHYNPAGLSRSWSHEASFMHNQHFQGVTHEHAGFASRWGWGAQVNYLDYGPVERTTISNKNGSLGQAGGSEMALGLGYGFKPFGPLTAGVGAKYVRGSLDLVTANGFAFDAGLLFKPGDWPGVSFGFSAQNLGSEIRFSDAQEKLPVSYRAGASLSFGQRPYEGHFAVDLIHRPHRDVLVGVGAEVVVAKVMPLRFGYGNRSSAGLGLTGGMGWIHGGWRIDYALVPFGALSMTHLVSVTARWGGQTSGGSRESGSAGSSRMMITPAVVYLPPPPAAARATALKSRTPVKSAIPAEQDEGARDFAPLEMKYFPDREEVSVAQEPAESQGQPSRGIPPEPAGPPAPEKKPPSIEPVSRKISSPRPAKLKVIPAPEPLLAVTLDRILRHPPGSSEREEALRSLLSRPQELAGLRALAGETVASALREEARSSAITTLSLRLLAVLGEKTHAPLIQNFLFNNDPEVVSEAAQTLAVLDYQAAVGPLEELVGRLDSDPRFVASPARPKAVVRSAEIKAALARLKARRAKALISP